MSDLPHNERRREDVPAVTVCPVCGGSMELVYNRNAQQVIVCSECHSGLTIPSTAWEVARLKRDGK